MLINNHFSYNIMGVENKLGKEFLSQDFSDEKLYSETIESCKNTAFNYARIENSIAVLSDIQSNRSYIYYGGLSRVLGIKGTGSSAEVHSIWEEEIFRLIHPDDLAEKHLQELRFFHFIKHQPKQKRQEYYLAQQLRMKNTSGSYIPVLHRIFYLPFQQSLRLALCLYNHTTICLPSQCMIINSADGQITQLGKQNDTKILSGREIQILRLIDKGMMSKDIAEALSISINTVSRHRQEILGRLQVKNSIEACRIAKDLKLI